MSRGHLLGSIFLKLQPDRKAPLLSGRVALYDLTLPERDKVSPLLIFKTFQKIRVK